MKNPSSATLNMAQEQQITTDFFLKLKGQQLMERKALSLWQEFSDIRTHLVVLGSRIPENTLLLHSLRPNIVSE